MPVFYFIFYFFISCSQHCFMSYCYISPPHINYKLQLKSQLFKKNDRRKHDNVHIVNCRGKSKGIHIHEVNDFTMYEGQPKIPVTSDEKQKPVNIPPPNVYISLQSTYIPPDCPHTSLAASATSEEHNIGSPKQVYTGFPQVLESWKSPGI